MKFELDDYHINVPEKELLEDLKKVASELSKDSITIFEYDEHGKFSSTTYKRRFGSWLKSLKKAGLEKNYNINVPVEELFRNLEEVWIKLGRQPRSREAQKPLSKFNESMYKRRFGSWRKSLEKFVEYVNNENKFFSETEAKGSKVGLSTKRKTSRDINWRLRFIVMRRDNFRCKNCGLSPASNPGVVLHVDHVKAWANGGETTLENLQTLCSKCNIGKSDLE